MLTLVVIRLQSLTNQTILCEGVFYDSEISYEFSAVWFDHVHIKLRAQSCPFWACIVNFDPNSVYVFPERVTINFHFFNTTVLTLVFRL